MASEQRKMVCGAHLPPPTIILLARCKRLEEFDGCVAVQVTEANGPATG